MTARARPVSATLAERPGTIVSKKKIFRLGLLTVTVIGSVGLFQLSKSRTFQVCGELVARVNTSQKVVALTFDDGPTVGPTDEVLAMLAAQDVKATFFVTGGELELNIAEGRKIVAAGHELGNHSYSHVRMVFVSPSFVKQEVESTDKLIRDVGYQGVINFRPPYGKKLFALPYYLAKTERTSVTWDVEPDSYPEIAADANKITDYVLAKTQPGSIIILHVMYGSRKESLKAVPQIITKLREQGYEFKTVSELLALAR
jgi:peptidoglycan-N-acetylglucosamine deacetylase